MYPAYALLSRRIVIHLIQFSSFHKNPTIQSKRENDFNQEIIDVFYTSIESNFNFSKIYFLSKISDDSS